MRSEDLFPFLFLMAQMKRLRHREICDLCPVAHRKPRGRVGKRNQVLKDTLEVLKTRLEAVAIV